MFSHIKAYFQKKLLFLIIYLQKDELHELIKRDLTFEFAVSFQRVPSIWGTHYGCFSIAEWKSNEKIS